MKKLITICLAIVICFSISVPAVAQDNEATQYLNTIYTDGEVLVQANDGDVLSFQIREANVGVYELDYYCNNELVRTYTLDITQAEVSAVEPSGREYIIDNTKTYTTDVGSVTNTISPYIGGVVTSLGEFHYYPVSGISYPSAAIANQITDSHYEQQRFVSAKNQAYADALASLTEGIIAGVITVVANPSNFALAVAASLLGDMIINAGGQVVNGLISVLLSEPYDIVTLDEELKAMAPSHSTVNYMYTETYVHYDGNDYELAGFGPQAYNRENWSTLAFAEAVWRDTYGRDGYSYPGLKSTTYE